MEYTGSVRVKTGKNGPFPTRSSLREKKTLSQESECVPTRRFTAKSVMQSAL